MNNNIDKNIFNSYEMVEAALLNDLATEARTKGSKVRVLKCEGYSLKFDGVWYAVTPDQCRIYKLIRNNYNRTVEHLNSAKSDFLGIWSAMWGERLQGAIARMEIELDICQKYFDAFKAYIIEGAKKEEVEEKKDEVEATENVSEEETAEESEVSGEEKLELTKEEIENVPDYMPVVGYEGLYEVGKDGSVWSLNYRRTGQRKQLRPAPNDKYGHLTVCLCKDGKRKTRSVHQLVLNAYLPKPSDDLVVMHIDSKPANNRLENLKWGTYTENNNDAHALALLSEALTNHPDLSTPVLCVETGVVYPSTKEAERQTGVNHGNISKCLNGKYKTAGGFHWRAG